MNIRNYFTTIKVPSFRYLTVAQQMKIDGLKDESRSEVHQECRMLEILGNLPYDYVKKQSPKWRKIWINKLFYKADRTEFLPSVIEVGGKKLGFRTPAMCSNSDIMEWETLLARKAPLIDMAKFFFYDVKKVNLLGIKHRYLHTYRTHTGKDSLASKFYKVRHFDSDVAASNERLLNEIPSQWVMNAMAVFLKEWNKSLVDIQLDSAVKGTKDKKIMSLITKGHQLLKGLRNTQEKGGLSLLSQSHRPVVLQ